MPESIRYRVSFPEAALHYAQVEMSVPALGRATVELSLPVWIPGSYMVREFARNLERVTATGKDGAALPVRKSAKNRFRVRAGGAAFTVTFRAWLFRQTVRESFVDAERATLNPVNLLPYVAGHEAMTHDLEIVPRAGWKRVDCPLDPLPGKGARFRAKDYEELADAVVQAGSHRAESFEVDGIPHLVTFVGEGNADMRRLAADCRKIVEVCRDLFGSLPYRRYIFMLEGWSQAGSGGLEHPACTLITVPSWGFAREDEYVKRLTLVAHEYFHVWNVKKIRPAGLGPFDWEKETLTDMLWVAEGFTSYYESILMLRAGLIDRDGYLKTVAKRIADYRNTPGRLLQSVAESSWDTWIKYYRQDENSDNCQISYYQKGALVAMLLDFELRRRSGGERTLDDLMRALDRESDAEGYRGYRFADVKRIAEGLAGAKLGGFFNKWVFGVDEIDFPRALARAGLACRLAPPEAAEAWLGAVTKREPNGNAPLVAKVHSGGPAAAAGVSAGDLIVALDGLRVTEETVKARLLDRKPGDGVRLALFRNDRLREVAVTLGTRATLSCAIKPAGKAGARAALREGWLAAPPRAGRRRETGIKGAGRKARRA